jgi:hypothetical protein
MGDNGMDEGQMAQIEETKPVIEASSSPTITSVKRDWKAVLVFVAGAGAVVWGLVSGLGTAWGLWPFGSGLQGFIWSAVLAIGAVLFGILFGWRAKRSGIKRSKGLRWAGMAIGALYAGWVLKFVFAALSVPAIHDISTDLADPPQFTAIVIRKDNLDAIPGIDNPDMKGLNPTQRWTLLHQKAFGDIRAVRINEPVAQVIAKAERLAKARGWQILLSSPEQGRLEATETSRFFGFKDDVVLRVRPTETGDGSIVDMRSVSRVGQSDLGVNAKRVRSFLADLSGTVTAG